MKKELRNEIESIMNVFPCIDSAILPSLKLIQNHYGYVSESDMEELARMLNFSEARIFSVASYYSMISLAPRGRHHIQVCTNVSCSLLEKETLYDYLSKKLGIQSGETTPDGRFSLEAVECLGSCGYAPALMINEEHYEGMSHEKTDSLLESLK